MNLNPTIIKFRPAWKRLGFRFGRRVPVYVPRPQQAAAIGPREPAELDSALTEADLARFFTSDPVRDTPPASPLPAAPPQWPAAPPARPEADAG